MPRRTDHRNEDTTGRGSRPVSASNACPPLDAAVLAFVDDLAAMYADLWAAGALDEIRREKASDDD
jgi:hypothetical protein